MVGRRHSSERGGITLWWILTFPMYVALIVLVFEASYIVYAKQTTERILQAAAQAGLATNRIVPQGIPEIKINTDGKVESVKLQLDNLAVKSDATLQRKAVIDSLARNIEGMGWGKDPKKETNKSVVVDMTKLSIVPLYSRRSDTIIFSDSLDFPRSTDNDQDTLLLKTEVTVHTPLLSQLYRAIYGGELNTPASITFPVQSQARIRFRVGKNIQTEFPPIDSN